MTSSSGPTRSLAQAVRRVKTSVSDAAWSPLLAAPARTPAGLAAAARGPLVVAGLFRTASGIGESARCCADALEARGLDVIRVDLSSHFRQQDMASESLLGEFPDAAAGTVILHLNAPEMVKAFAGLRLFRPKCWRVIGYWVWEFEAAPESWARADRLVSEIWTPTRFSADALRHVTDRPIKIAPHAIRPPAEAAARVLPAAIPQDATVVLSMADGRSSLSRKNIVGAVEAFRKGLGDRSDCWMVVKTRNINQNPLAAREVACAFQSHPRILLVDETLSAEERWGLINSCDIYLSLHRCEGFGLTIAEAMALGKPVVATAWSGNMDFVDDQSAALIPYAFDVVQDSAGIYNQSTAGRWADPDISAAAAALRRLADDPSAARLMGERGAAIVRERLNGKAYYDALA